MISERWARRLSHQPSRVPRPGWAASRSSELITNATRPKSCLTAHQHHASDQVPSLAPVFLRSRDEHSSIPSLNFDVQVEESPTPPTSLFYASRRGILRSGIWRSTAALQASCNHSSAAGSGLALREEWWCGSDVGSPHLGPLRTPSIISRWPRGNGPEQETMTSPRLHSAH